MKVYTYGPIFNDNAEILEAEELNDEEILKFNKRYSKLLFNKNERG